MKIKKLKESDYKELSIKYGIGVSSIKAIAYVEGSGSGFDEKTGK